MKRQQIIENAYTTAREILTKSLYENWKMRKEMQIVGRKEINDIVYTVSFDHPCGIEVFIDRANGKSYDFIADKVAGMLTEDYDAIEQQIEELIEEDNEEYEDLQSHYESLEYQFAV